MTDNPLESLKSVLSGRYRIESEIDRGGMAVVFLAEDLKHHRKVAIKVLRSTLAASLGTERFLREIDVIAKLQHPNILPLHDSGAVDEVPYYVMPFVEGQSLRAMLDREDALPLEEAVRIACEVAEALECAHQRGVVHRDIKPANILISGGHAVVADFGIAAAVDEAAVGRLTDTGVSMGSPAYMSPEQAGGERDLDGRTDVYGLGCVLYEMLGGTAPFHGSLKTLLTQKVMGEAQPLREIRPDLPAAILKAVTKAMSPEREDRFVTAAEFRGALLAGLPKEEPKGWGRRRTIAAAGAVLAVAVLAGVLVVRDRREAALRVWAAQTLAEVEDLADGGAFTEALELAREVEAVVPDDTTLARLYPAFSYTISIRTDPPGARVLIRDLDDPEGEWEPLGLTPQEDIRFAGTTFETEAYGVNHNEDHPHILRFEMEGYRPRELLKTAVLGVNWRGIPPMDPVLLEPVDPSLDGMVRLPGFSFLPGGATDTIRFSDFYMDRYEVTNRMFKQFVDAGGYQHPEYWVHPFEFQGREIDFEEATTLFRDQTGRPGPSTWRLGTYPEGEEDYPVGGVSWHEAAAFARWIGKELPSTRQWNQARTFYRENSYVIAPRSNLGSSGPRAVGLNDAMTTLGVYDLVGNVREWCDNEVGPGQHATRGGAWPDAPFHVGWIIPKDDFDRDPTHGIRLIKSFDDEEALATLRHRVAGTTVRDYRAEEPVSDPEFQVIRGFYAYDAYALNPSVERADTLADWILEVVAFDVPYGERGGAALYLPRVWEPPFQAIIYWGGSGIYSTRSVEEEWTPAFDFLVKAGRAVVVPIFKGAYGRNMPPPGQPRYGRPYTSTNYRNATIEWVKDLSSTIDYLETRADIQADRIGYYGFSHGGYVAPIPMAVEDRLKVAVTNVGGLTGDRFLPAAEPFNFLPRVTDPFLMINGKYDIVFPYETSQVPMYELLGTPREDKEHYVYPAGHLVPEDDLIREMLAWYDKYLGMPGGS